jgi:hypothetical protein
MKSTKTAVIAPSAVALSAAARIDLALETLLAAFHYYEHPICGRRFASQWQSSRGPLLW